MGPEQEDDPFVRTNNAPKCSDGLVKPKLTRLGEPKLFTWRKVGPAQRVTRLGGVSLLNWFATFCNEMVKSQLARSPRQLGQASDLSIWGNFSPYKLCLSAITFYLSFRSSDGKLLCLVQFTMLTKSRIPEEFLFTTKSFGYQFSSLFLKPTIVGGHFIRIMAESSKK